MMIFLSNDSDTEKDREELPRGINTSTDNSALAGNTV